MFLQVGHWSGCQNFGSSRQGREKGQGEPVEKLRMGQARRKARQEVVVSIIVVKTRNLAKT
jgi:hypothetical protein